MSEVTEKNSTESPIAKDCSDNANGKSIDSNLDKGNIECDPPSGNKVDSEVNEVNDKSDTNGMSIDSARNGGSEESEGSERNKGSGGTKGTEGNKKSDANGDSTKSDANGDSRKSDANRSGKESDENGSNDPYAYLGRSQFTSEKFKIEVHGLPKNFGIGEFKKLLVEKLRLDCNKVKYLRPNSNWVFVCFRNQENRDRALELLNGYLWRNSKLSAKAAKPAADPYLVSKRKRQEEEKATKKLRIRDGDETGKEGQQMTSSERIKMQTTPLSHLSYPEQLEYKQEEIKGILKGLSKSIRNLTPEDKGITEWIKRQSDANEGLPCEFQGILSGEQVIGYRNKCEFTVGKDNDGNKIIGFRLSSYADGSVAVGPIDELCHIPDNVKTAIKLFQEFIRNSELDVFNPVCNEGHWRQVTARSSRLGHLMLIIVVYLQQLDEVQQNQLKERIKEYFLEGAGKDSGVTSLFLQTVSARSSENGSKTVRLEKLLGMDHIVEELFDMKFLVSPEAFFQVNSSGAEVLYKAALDLAEADENTTVLDICCGTGTIGLCFSKHCGEVLGIEVVEEAVKNAKENMATNQVTNCEFFTGKAEDILSSVIRRATKPKIVAVVDPPRSGMHREALLALRKANQVSRIVFISCDPKAAARNLIDLARARSNKYRGEPFVPVKAVAVDMFPHTKHCELIVCLDRLSRIAEKSEQAETAT